MCTRQRTVRATVAPPRTCVPLRMRHVELRTELLSRVVLAVMRSLATAQDGQKAGGLSNMRRQRRYTLPKPRKGAEPKLALLRDLLHVSCTGTNGKHACMLPRASRLDSRHASPLAQAVRAVETLNGTDLGGRKILVREDREDKDVKNYNRCACLGPGLPAHLLCTLELRST